MVLYGIMLTDVFLLVVVISLFILAVALATFLGILLTRGRNR